MLSIKPALLLLALHFGTAIASTTTSLQDKEWHQHVVPNVSIFYHAKLPTINSKKVQEDFFKVLYCNNVPGFWVNQRLTNLCRKFPNKRMFNPNLQSVGRFNSRRRLILHFSGDFMPNFRGLYIDGLYIDGLSDDVKSFHGELDKLVSPLSNWQHLNLLLPQFLIPKIATEDDIKNRRSVKPHLVLVSDYIKKDIKDTIYDEHPLKEVMEAIKQVKDKSKIDQFAADADQQLKTIVSSVNLDILENLPELIHKMTDFEQSLVIMAKDCLDPTVKDEVIRKVRECNERHEKEEMEREAWEALSEMGEGPGSLFEFFKNAKQEGEQKREELEAKVAQLVAENDKIKAQLAASSPPDLAQKYQEATTEVEKMKTELAKKDTEAASKYQEAMKDIQELNAELVKKDAEINKSQEALKEIKELKEQQAQKETENSKKYQEAEAEIKRVKKLLAEREAEVSSSKQDQIYAENVARIAKGKEDKLQKEVKKLEELLRKKESEPPVVVFTPPPPTKSVDLAELFVYGFFALIVIFFLVSFIASICRRQRRDIV